MIDVINQMWRSLGLWTFVFNDYLDMNIMKYLNTPPFKAMADIIDPVIYMKYLANVPKYMIFATGDEFFLPDNARNFYTQLQGDKYLRMVPNAEHSLTPYPALIINNIANFALYIKHGDPIPSLKETIFYSNTTASISVTPSQPPTEATLWYGTTISKTRRDFRLVICSKLPDCLQPVFWLPQTLKPAANGSYTASVSVPWDGGWTGFVIVLSYKSKYSAGGWFDLTSQVVIVPDMYPFPFCGLSCQNNATMPLNMKIG